MTNDETRRNDEFRMTKRNSDTLSSFEPSDLFRHSTFVLRHLIHIPLVALITFKLFNILIGLLNAFAALLLNDFAQRSVDVFGHPARIATHEKMRALRVEPFPNFGGIFHHLVLHVDLLGLIA